MKKVILKMTEKLMVKLMRMKGVRSQYQPLRAYFLICPWFKR